MAEITIDGNSDEIQIDGDLEELCAQIDSGEAAEGYARMQLSNLQRLRECADAAERVSFPLHSPLPPGTMPPDMREPEPERTVPFRDRLRAMLRMRFDHAPQEP